MAIKRGPDGIPVDMPSIKYKGEALSEGPTGGEEFSGMNLGDEPTIKGQRDDKTTSPPQKKASQSLFLDEPPTLPAMNRGERGLDINAGNASAVPQPPLEEPKTVIVGARQQQSYQSPSASISSSGSPTVKSSANDAMSDPVAGWLVVISGPGQGNFLKLGYGQNSVGRNASERVPLDFGDSQVSRSSHFLVTYDPRGRKFYIQPGSGTNLTYLNDEPTPLLQPMLLAPFSHVSLGDTVLRFVPLCGDDFFWDEVKGK